MTADQLNELLSSLVSDKSSPKALIAAHVAARSLLGNDHLMFDEREAIRWDEMRLWQWIDYGQPYNFGVVDNGARGQFKIAEFKTLRPIVNRHHPLIDAPVARSTPLLIAI